MAMCCFLLAIMLWWPAMAVFAAGENVAQKLIGVPVFGLGTWLIVRTVLGGFIVTPGCLVIKDPLGTRRVRWQDINEFGSMFQVKGSVLIYARVGRKRLYSSCLSPVVLFSDRYERFVLVQLEHHRQLALRGALGAAGQTSREAG
ncbi:MAG: hypothetical protein JWM40_911 [Frankiales bacterium]|nr:hypothetical protein [Frankiales bacterium]